MGAPGTGEDAAEADVAQALTLAGEGDCGRAEQSWRLAWQHLPRAKEWQDAQRALVAPKIAACWVDLARRSEDWRDAVRALESARFWDRHVDGLWTVAEQVGSKLYDQGLEARAREDWVAAYEAFDGAVRADTRLSWARRYAEETRDQRLGIAVEEAPAPKPAPVVKPAAGAPAEAPAEEAEAPEPSPGGEGE